MRMDTFLVLLDNWTHTDHTRKDTQIDTRLFLVLLDTHGPHTQRYHTHRLTHDILEKVRDKCDIKIVSYTKQGEQIKPAII